MRQYIYFEGKTEYMINRKVVEQYPIGKLMFSILDVDWHELFEQAETAQGRIRNNEGKPYFLVATFYQQQREMLQAVHPHLFGLVDAYLDEKIIKSFSEDYPVAHDFALRLFRHYPNEPMSAKFFHEFMYERGHTVPDESLIAVATGFMKEISRLYRSLNSFAAELKEMVDFALDEEGVYSGLSSRQRFYLMQISEFSPFMHCKELHENVGIERRILEETVLDYDRYKQVTPELIQEIQEYELDAYTFYLSTDIRSLVFLEFEYMCSNDLMIRKCEHCGRYFLPYSKVSLFCERPVDDTGRTCKDIGAMEKFNQKVVADEARSLFRRLNNAYQMRTKRAPGVYTREAYEEWRDDARGLLKQVEEGEMTVEEFEERVQVKVKQIE